MQTRTDVFSADMAKRLTLNLEVSEATRKKFPKLMDDLGIKQKDLMARLVDWFANQDGKIQTAIVTRFPGVKETLAMDVARSLAGMQAQSLVEVGSVEGQTGGESNPQNPQRERHDKSSKQR